MTVQLLQVEARQKHTTTPATIAIDSNSFVGLIASATAALDAAGANAMQFHDVTKPYALKGDAPAGTDIALLPGFACVVPRNRANLLETSFSLQMNLDVTRAAGADSWALVFVDRRDQEILFTAQVAKPVAIAIAIAIAIAPEVAEPNGAAPVEGLRSDVADDAADDVAATAPAAATVEPAQQALID